MLHQTHCDFHLGDNLVHLHFLRKQAIANPRDTFFHYAHECHLEQLREAIEDLPNISLYSIDVKPSASIDAWKNAGAGTSTGGYFEKSWLREDFCAFHIAWFGHIAQQMGLRPVFEKPTDFLFDYPAIQKDVTRRLPTGYQLEKFDILFINSRPCSGQCMAYDDLNYFDPLIEELKKRYCLIVTQKTGLPPLSGEWGIRCTTETEMTVSEIGSLSLRCNYIIGVATGPLWPTFNIWNQQSVTRRIVMLGNGERLNLGANITQVSNREEMREALVREGLL
jgi:hypothetical protein